MSRPTDR